VSHFEGDMNEDKDVHDGYEFARVSDDVINAEWQQCCAAHIQPSHLFRLGVGLIPPSDQDRHHLHWCDKCRSVFDRYKAEQHFSDRRVQSVCAGPYAGDGSMQSQPSLFDGLNEMALPAPVPNILRTHLRVEGPIVFPNGEVALDTWQLGRLEHLSRANPEVAGEIVKLIVERSLSLLVPRLIRQKVALVCFGRTLHRIGTLIAARLIEHGFTHPHVVLAHDFYSPTLIRAPKELQGADVTVMVDVVHTGALLRRLFAVCRPDDPSRLRGLAVVDQSLGELASEGVLSLWTESPEVRMPLEQFRQTASTEQQRRLTRFEPNAECAVDAPEIIRSNGHEVNDLSPMDDDSVFVELIQRAEALRCDYTIANKRYPYVINVLDLVREPESRARILSMASGLLADLKRVGTCLVYHAGRIARAGKIAKMLGSNLQWPVIKLGTRGPSFAVTEQQHKRLSNFGTLIIVDAAIRTGDSLTAMVASLDPNVRANKRVIAFCVLDALSRTSRDGLAQGLGIEIRTLFRAPLAPPAQRVRDWMKIQKRLISEALCESGQFADIEHILSTYCEHGRRRRNSKSHRSLDETKAALRRALWDARAPEHPVEYIGSACKEGKGGLIRLLPLEPVIHDRSVQSLLLGVMYNSMRPSIKESAVFALGAARNYDWMTYEWLQCNRAFFGSQSHCWKSVLMIECEMKLNERNDELSRFRDALKKFAAKLVEHRPWGAVVRCAQPVLSFHEESESHGSENEKPLPKQGHQRLRERINVLMEVAG